MGFDYMEYIMNRLDREERLRQKELAYQERQKAYRERMQEQELE